MTTTRKAAPASKKKRKPNKRRPGKKDGTPEQGKPGRPTVYTEAMGAEICARLADGESLNSICRDGHMPDEKTVRMWALDAKHPVSPNYARAREIGAMRLADEILAISAPKDGDDATKVARDRLQVDTRKWLLAKVLPKIYGDKLTTEVTGADGGPVKAEVTRSPEQAARLIAFALHKAKLTMEAKEKEDAEKAGAE